MWKHPQEVSLTFLLPLRRCSSVRLLWAVLCLALTGQDTHVMASMTPIRTGQTRPQLKWSHQAQLCHCHVWSARTSPPFRAWRACVRLTEGISKPRVGLLMGLLRGCLNHSYTRLVIRITCGCLQIQMPEPTLSLLSLNLGGYCIFKSQWVENCCAAL